MNKVRLAYFVFLLCFLLVLPLASATVGIDEITLPKLQGEVKTPAINYSLVGVNDSLYWAGNAYYNMSLPFYSWLGGFLYNYNQTTPANAYTDSKLQTRYWNATENLTVTGTYQGTIEDIQSYDNKALNISEVGSDYDFRLNFTGVTEDINSIVLRARAPTEASGHVSQVELWDYDEGIWENYATLIIPVDYQVYTFGVFDPDEHISGGVIQMRMWTTNVGASTHKYEFDWATLVSGPATPSSSETDPYSIHKDGSVPLTGNWNAGLFNITADWGFMKINWSNIQNVLYSVFSNTHTHSFSNITTGTATGNYTINNGTLSISGVARIAGTPTTECPASMVAYWQAEDNGNDYFGRLNATAAGGGVTYATSGCPLNHCWILDGSTTSNLKNATAFNYNTEEFTIMGWGNLTGKTSAESNILGLFGQYQHVNTYRVLRYYGNHIEGYADGKGGYPGVLGTDPTLGVWAHYTFVRNSTDLIMYINGVQDAILHDASGTWTGDDTFMIGSEYSNNRCWKGRIDEVAYFNSSLSPSEVYRLYDNTMDGHDYCYQEIGTASLPRNITFDPSALTQTTGNYLCYNWTDNKVRFGTTC